jgi:hypothetical protein
VTIQEQSTRLWIIHTPVAAAKSASPPETESPPMFIAITRPVVEPRGSDPVAVSGSPDIVPPSPRALHARLLENAALRRRRGAERRRSRRPDDADYWLKAAPVAVRKASALREEKSFAPLP